MEKKRILNGILSVIGTIMAWLPLAAPVFLGLITFPRFGNVRIDYLMPAELAPVALIGGGLLLWAAIRMKSDRKLIGWSFGTAIGMLAGGQVLAVLFGFASGETEPAGWKLILVIGSIAVYTVSLAIMGYGGIRLLRGQWNSR